MSIHPTWLLPPQEFKGSRTRQVMKVRIGDRIFPSAMAAASILGKSESHIRTLIYRNKAEYIIE